MKNNIEKYSKWIGYCFNGGWVYKGKYWDEDGKCKYEFGKEESGKYEGFITDYKGFKEIYNSTCLPK